ncbi:MAG: MOSC domain-containing protein [Microthrixaceae bacterium]
MADVLTSAGGTGSDLGSLAASVRTRLEELVESLGPRTPLADVLDPGDPLVVAIEECDRLLSLAARSVCRELDHRDSGSVVRVATSAGGVPKSPLHSARIDRRGLVGDLQADRANHGRPFQAVSLYSAERIEDLAAEGHPVTPGAVGENLLLSGIGWSSLRVGQRLAVGSEVLLELSAWAPPCRTIAGAFCGGRFDRIDHDKHPGWARWYAWVLVPGGVSTGDPVDLFAA